MTAHELHHLITVIGIALVTLILPLIVMNRITTSNKLNLMTTKDLKEGMYVRVHSASVHANGTPSAYIGMEGIVKKLHGGFVIDTGNSSLICSLGKDRGGLRFYGRETKLYFSIVM